MSTRRGFRTAIAVGAGILLVAVIVLARSNGRTSERTLEIEPKRRCVGSRRSTGIQGTVFEMKTRVACR